MQRYSRDRDRDDEGGRSERGSQARGEERYSQGQQRDQRSAFGGTRERDDERSTGYESSAVGSNRATNRWREPGSTVRDRMEEQFGAGSQGDQYTGGSLYGGQRYEDQRGNWNECGDRSAWQPSSQSSGYPQRSPYGETEYGGYGPRDGSSYGGGATRGSGYGGYSGAQQGYADERGDDRYGRQGYGQSGVSQSGHERAQHQRFDSDYQQWRDEQIRNLDNDYQIYRQERYKKFSDEFDSWRRNRKSGSGTSSSVGLSGQGSSGTSALSGLSDDTGSTDLSSPARDSLGTSKSSE